MPVKPKGIINIDKELCTGCRRCAEICPTRAIRGAKGTPQFIDKGQCVVCGQCVQACNVYAAAFTGKIAAREQKLQERNMLPAGKEPLFAAYYAGHAPTVKAALMNPNLFAMVQCAPAVRVAIAEEFGLPLGSLTAGQMAAMLRKLGFKRVYDTAFAAELLVMEESSELIERITGGGVLPMFTSSCPAWVRFIEQAYPELISHLSSCKSPQQMTGALYKAYGAGLDGVVAAKVFSVSVVSCTGKKFECERPEMETGGYRDVDAVITTQELARLIKNAGIDVTDLPEETFDKPIGLYSDNEAGSHIEKSAREAALRIGYELLTNQKSVDGRPNFIGSNSVRKSVVKVGNGFIKVAAAAGLKNVVPILEAIKGGKADFHFLEIMACPGGCISGGGQPKTIMPDGKVNVYSNRIITKNVQKQSCEYKNLHNRHKVQEFYDKLLEDDSIEQLLHTTFEEGKWCKNMIHTRCGMGLSVKLKKYNYKNHVV